MTTVDNASSNITFKDLFSHHSRTYAEHLSAYPDALFSFLADRCSRRALAWHSATGNDQAAHRFDLAAFFEEAQRLIAPGGVPLALIEDRLRDAGGGGECQVSWPLNVRVGGARIVSRRHF